MGVKNRFNLVQLRHYNQFIKNISITAPQTIIIDFTSEINIKIKMLNALKNTEITMNIPVLGIIDNDDLQVEQMVLAEGINMVLKSPFNINQLENYLNNLCNSHSMSNASQNLNKNDFPRIPNTLIELLNKTIEEQIKLGDLSNQAITLKVGMNYKSLNLKIKILTDQTLAAYVLNYRLEKAKKLLASDLLIKEICYDCGFDDSANFNRAF